ncbi:MAG: LPXTG cell wall anchor domain-containing protein [Actinobacteria bacterium]|nr:LPXTG cell wall anchor domain-containing protein [Actinomycetota bacterium]
MALPEIPRSLPRTGGTPWLPIVGVAGLAAAFLGRRAIVRSH